MSPVIEVWLHSLVPIIALSCVAWVLCTVRRNAGLVDIFWPWFFLAAAGYDSWRYRQWSGVSLVMAALLIVWALRLSVHLAIRNWHAPEDRRYAEIRARHQPGFAWKSLLLVYGFQALLAWIVSAPLAVGLAGRSSAGPVWIFGLMLAVSGLAIEACADQQLRAFKRRDPQHREVLDTGLWRYSRHPNYFGEFCLWWGLFAMAIRADAIWIVVSPLLMSLLLLRVSGVSLLEKDIAHRRPAYRDYVTRTPVFFPWKPAASTAARHHNEAQS
jgi:steroid 5-alpha reductase family enzyme